MPASKLVDFHAAFAQKYKFRVPIHPRNLAQVIYPYQGYMASFKNREFSWPEMVEVYENQIIASEAKASGRHLLSNELSCFTFWDLVESKNKAFFTFDEMKELMQAFRFDHVQTQEDFMKEFEVTLRAIPGELKEKHLKNGEGVFRFDLARQIFLERGL